MLAQIVKIWWEVLQFQSKLLAYTMALWPTEAAARAFVDARALSTWVGIDDEAFDAVETLLGSFNGRIRNLGMLPASVLVTAITQCPSRS